MNCVKNSLSEFRLLSTRLPGHNSIRTTHHIFLFDKRTFIAHNSLSQGIHKVGKYSLQLYVPAYLEALAFYFSFQNYLLLKASNFFNFSKVWCIVYVSLKSRKQ